MCREHTYCTAAPIPSSPGRGLWEEVETAHLAQASQHVLASDGESSQACDVRRVRCAGVLVLGARSGCVCAPCTLLPHARRTRAVQLLLALLCLACCRESRCSGGNYPVCAPPAGRLSRVSMVP